MTHEQIVKTLVTLRKNAKWSLHGDTLEGLTWLDNEQTRPTDEEILEKIE
jgi:hypothetical protein